MFSMDCPYETREGAADGFGSLELVRIRKQSWFVGMQEGLSRLLHQVIDQKEILICNLTERNWYRISRALMAHSDNHNAFIERGAQICHLQGDIPHIQFISYTCTLQVYPRKDNSIYSIVDKPVLLTLGIRPKHL